MGEIANRDNKKMLILFAEVVAALATILIAVLAMKIPVVPVCVIVLIEVAIAACLQEVPVWYTPWSPQYSWLPGYFAAEPYSACCVF
mgnify:CR=1 FL=1